MPKNRSVKEPEAPEKKPVRPETSKYVTKYVTDPKDAPASPVWNGKHPFCPDCGKKLVPVGGGRAYNSNFCTHCGRRIKFPEPQ